MATTTTTTSSLAESDDGHLAIISLEQGWSEIREQGIDRLRAILAQDAAANGTTTSEKPKLVFPRDEAGKVYTIVYGMCHQAAPHNWSDELYHRYRTQVEDYLAETVAPGLTDALAQTNDPATFLQLLTCAWERFEFFQKWMNAFFRVLDRNGTNNKQQPTQTTMQQQKQQQSSSTSTPPKRPSLASSAGAKRPSVSEVAMSAWETIILHHKTTKKDSPSKNNNNNNNNTQNTPIRQEQKTPPQQTHNQDAMGAMLELIRRQRCRALERALRGEHDHQHGDDPRIVQTMKKIHQMWTTLDYRNTIGRGSTRMLNGDNDPMMHQRQWQEQLLVVSREFYSKLREDWRNPQAKNGTTNHRFGKTLSLATYFDQASQALELETARAIQYVDQMIITTGTPPSKAASTSNIVGDNPSHETTVAIVEQELFQKAHLQMPAAASTSALPNVEPVQPPAHKPTRRGSLSSFLPRPIHRIFQRRSSLNGVPLSKSHSHRDPSNHSTTNHSNHDMSSSMSVSKSSSRRTNRLKNTSPAVKKPSMFSSRSMRLNSNNNNDAFVGMTVLAIQKIDTSRWQDDSMLAKVRKDPKSTPEAARRKVPRRPSLKMNNDEDVTGRGEDSSDEEEDDDDDDDLSNSNKKNADWRARKQLENTPRRDSGDFHASLGIHNLASVSDGNDEETAKTKEAMDRSLHDDDDDEDEDEEESGSDEDITSSQRERDVQRLALKKKLIEEQERQVASQHATMKATT